MRKGAAAVLLLAALILPSCTLASKKLEPCETKRAQLVASLGGCNTCTCDQYGVCVCTSVLCLRAPKLEITTLR